MARTVSTKEARFNLVNMAQVWQRLADQQDQGSDITSAPTPTTTPS